MPRSEAPTPTAVLAAAVLALTAVSCGARPPAATPRDGFSVSKAAPLVLVVDDDGRFIPADAAPRRAPEPFPVAKTAASIQPTAEGAIVAVNRVGLSRLRVVHYPAVGATGEAEIRLLVEPISGAEGEFAGRTVAPSWSRGGAALFLLYRHPIFETSTTRIPSSVVVTASFNGAQIFEPSIGADAYAVFPSSADSWLVQSRRESGDRVETGYARVSARDGSAESLERAAFERQASPEPIAAAPEPIRTAAAVLGGPLLVETRMPDGSRRVFVRGDPGQAAPAWAQVLDADTGGIRACLVTDDWRVVIVRLSADGYRATALGPAAPVPGAAARDAAVVDGLVVVLWEEDLFPDVGWSGLLAIDPGL